MHSSACTGKSAGSGGVRCVCALISMHWGVCVCVCALWKGGWQSGVGKGARVPMCVYVHEGQMWVGSEGVGRVGPTCGEGRAYTWGG